MDTNDLQSRLFSFAWLINESGEFKKILGSIVQKTRKMKNNLKPLVFCLVPFVLRLLSSK